MAFRYKHGDRPLEGYTIQRGVGAGGFGEVYYAVSDGGRQVALKCLQHNQEIELRGVGQCMNLKSPYLVTVFDVKTGADGSAFVIMEYVTGPSLRDLLREAPAGMGPQKAAFLTREIQKGLSYLHERGIVHRDLKPENIFFEDGYVKIGDYGLSKYISVSRQSCQTISVGTVHYMAPEIGSGRYHRGIDIYALGVILFEMLCGHVPFTGDSFGEILMKHLTVEPDLSGLAPPFRPVLEKALAKNPDQRYARVEEMAEDFQRTPEIEGWLREFRPETLASNGHRPVPGIQETVVLAGAPAAAAGGQSPSGGQAASRIPGPGGLPRLPGLAPLPGGAAEPRLPPPPRFPPPLPGFNPERLFSGDSVQRHFLSLWVAAGVSVALTLLSSQGGSMFFGSLLVIVSGAFAVLLCERDGPGRWVFEPGLPRRLLTLCVSSPLFLIAMAFFHGSEGKRSIIALIISMAVTGWEERTRQRRQQRISLHHAFTAGLFGLCAGLVLSGIPTLVAGAMAAISLVVNSSSPFGRAPAGRSRDGGTGREPEGGAAAPPDYARGTAETRSRAVSAGGAALARARASGLPRPLPAWARVFWLGCSAAFLALTLSLGIFALVGLRDPTDRAVALSFALASGGFFGFTSRLGWARSWPGFLAVTRAFLVTLCLNGAAASTIVLFTFGMREAEPALFCLIFALVFALFLGLLPSRLRNRGERGLRGGAEPPPSSPGWSALGALLVTLGISVTLGSALLASGLGETILHEAELPAGLSFQRLVASQMHLLFGAALFLPGLFCVLKSRQEQGAAHVFRGAIGFGTAGALVFLLSQLIHSGIFTAAGGTIEFRPVGFIWPAGLFGLGIVAALLLFWPARAQSGLA